MPKNDLRLGVALSGGGFRATLFHLGVLRFFRDARLLRHIRHISSVSGGSILAAHAVQHWDRYAGDSDKDFCDAAGEIIKFAQRDLRGQIVRRLPYRFIVWRWQRSRYLINAYRNLLKTDLLVADPDRPELSIMTTNLSTGRPWSFDSIGFTEEPAPHTKDRLRTTLPVTALRVAASSAFPAFFPSIRMTARDLGFDNSTFPYPQFFTDGGVYDNLGILKFVWLLQKAKSAGSSREHDLDIVMVSDAGRGFDWTTENRTSGLFRTVSRSMDIAMNRVGTLDLEGSTGLDARFRLIAIGAEAPRNGVSCILSEDIQRQLKSIRTDLDNFSEFEIRCLVIHGYSVAHAVWTNLLLEAESASSDVSERTCTKILKLPRGPATFMPWDPFQKPTTSGKQTRATQDDNAVFVSASAVPTLQECQKLRARLFAARDWISYLNVALLLLVTIASYKFLAVVFRRESPDYLARTYSETIEIIPPTGAGARGSMTRTIAASFIKLKNDGAMLERGAATRGDRIDAVCFTHPDAEYRESRLTFPGVMTHEYVLKIPLKYDASLLAQNVSYQFRFINNLAPDHDWIYLIPAFPIEHCVMTIIFPPSKPCKHLTFSKITESGVKKSVLFDSQDATQRTASFDWDLSAGRFTWTVNNLKPEPAGYRVDFDW